MGGGPALLVLRRDDGLEVALCPHEEDHARVGAVIEDGEPAFKGAEAGLARRVEAEERAIGALQVLGDERAVLFLARGVPDVEPDMAGADVETLGKKRGAKGRLQEALEIFVKESVQESGLPDVVVAEDDNFERGDVVHAQIVHTKCIDRSLKKWE